MPMNDASNLLLESKIVTLQYTKNIVYLNGKGQLHHALMYSAIE